ncbi:MAG: heme biosynthesis HemY N-terminal domain-containing protein [Moraxellaceae bacterium]
MRVSLLMLSFLMLLMVLAGALFASSLSRDAGYVLVLWQGWQLQTGVGFFLLLLLCISVLIVLLLLLFSALSGGFGRAKKIQQQAQQQMLTQLQHAMVYQILHAPEQALDRLSLQQVQQPSGWLRLAQLHFAAQINQHGNLQRYLADIPAPQQVFAQLIQAEWCLNQRQPEQALPLLFTVYPALPEHLPAHWQPAVEQAVLRLWGQYAAQQAWAFLQVQPRPVLTPDAQQAWLQALQAQHVLASPEQSVQLLAYYDQQTAEQRLGLFLAWLRVLLRIAAADERAWLLAMAYLQQQLDPEALWLWLGLALRPTRTALEQQQTEQLFVSLNQRYPAQPNVRLAQACWLHAQQRVEAAQQLLGDWPTTELTDRFNLLCQLNHYPTLYQRLAPVLHDFATVESVL